MLCSENGEVGQVCRRAGSMSIGTLDPVQISEWSPRDPLHFHIPCGQMFKWSRDPRLSSNYSPSSLSPSGWSDPPRSQSTISSYLTAEGEWIATRDQGSLCSYTSLFNCSRELLNPFSWSDLLRSQHYLVFLEWPRKGTQWTYSLRAVAKWSSRLTFLHWEIILRPEPQISGHGISLAG